MRRNVKHSPRHVNSAFGKAAQSTGQSVRRAALSDRGCRGYDGETPGHVLPFSPRRVALRQKSTMNERRSDRSMRSFLGSLAVYVIVCTAVGGALVRAGDEAGMQPIAVWPAGPIEVVAAFDRPVARSSAAALVGQSVLYFDGSKSAAARGSSSRLLGQLRIAAIRLIDDNRTLVLATDPHPCDCVLHPTAAGPGSEPADWCQSESHRGLRLERRRDRLERGRRRSCPAALVGVVAAARRGCCTSAHAGFEASQRAL